MKNVFISKITSQMLQQKSKVFLNEMKNVFISKITSQMLQQKSKVNNIDISVD